MPIFTQDASEYVSPAVRKQRMRFALTGGLLSAAFIGLALYALVQ